MEHFAIFALLAHLSVAAGPQIVIPEWEYDVGDIYKYEFRRATFVVENHGDAPLTLSAEPLAPIEGEFEISELTPVIPPGETGKVVAEISIYAEPMGPFMRTIVLNTNDPEVPQTFLRVRGAMKLYIQHFPPIYNVYMEAFRGTVEEEIYVLHSEAQIPLVLSNVGTSNPAFTATLTKVEDEYARIIKTNIAQVPEVVARRGDYILSVKSNPEATLGSYMSESIIIQTNITGYPEHRIPAMLIIRELPRVRMKREATQGAPDS